MPSTVTPQFLKCAEQELLPLGTWTMKVSVSAVSDSNVAVAFTRYWPGPAGKLMSVPGGPEGMEEGKTHVREF